MKKLLAILFAALMVFSLVACGDAESSDTKKKESEKTTAAAEEGGDETEAAAYTTKIAGPVVVTTIGQSDMNQVEQILKKAGIEYTADAKLAADAVNGGTLIMAVGGSNKGLGSAGVSTDDEITRGEALIAKAKETGAQVICMHLGGSSRRGSTSDIMIQPMVEKCDFLVIASDGDSDGQLTAWAGDTPVATFADVKSAVSAIEALK